jgi:hypothetical protein
MNQQDLLAAIQPDRLPPADEVELARLRTEERAADEAVRAVAVRMTPDANLIMIESRASGPFGRGDARFSPEEQADRALAAEYRAVRQHHEAALRALNGFRRALRDRAQAEAEAEYRASLPPRVPQRTERATPRPAGSR